MKEILIAIQYLLPSLVVFGAVWYVMREFFKQENIRRQLKMMEDKQRISLPLRLQAYERIVLFLERISPGNLVMRTHKPDYSVRKFQQVLLQNIRDEFDHNLSQQVYISTEAWERIKMAKEEMIQQINAAAAQLKDDDPSTDLSRKLLGMSIEKSATRNALDFVKTEAARLF